MNNLISHIPIPTNSHTHYLLSTRPHNPLIFNSHVSMGQFVTSILSTDVKVTETLFTEILKAFTSGDWQAFLENEIIWDIASKIKHDNTILQNIINYVELILDERSTFSRYIISLIYPELTDDKFNFMYALLRLRSLSILIKSQEFWLLVLDKEFLTKLFTVDYHYGSLLSELASGLSLVLDDRIIQILKLIHQHEVDRVRVVTSDTHESVQSPASSDHTRSDQHTTNTFDGALVLKLLLNDVKQLKAVLSHYRALFNKYVVILCLC